ncbi:MAG: PorP/SprF family type IX secretion system membrane protein [Bacteroidetes bacterium]|nr:PorP/SprF family type IX secretion system membrane protein [Bacteroidota bacterium]
MKTIKKLLIIGFLIAMLIPAAAQDPQYSQWTANPTYYNPGYVGISQGMRTRFAYRQQWVKLPEDFRNFNFNMDLAARNIPGSGGLGLMFDSDNEGEGYIKRTMIGATVAVRIPIHHNMITQFGILASFVQKRIDWNRLVFTDQLDERYGNIYETSFKHPSDDRVTYPDFGVGGVFRFVQPTWKATEVIGSIGIAVHHLFRPNETFLQQSSPLPRKLVVTGDFIVQDEINRGRKKSFNISEGGFKFNPGVIYMYQGGMQSYSAGINVYRDPVYVGIWYRNDEFEFLNNDALVLTAGLSIFINEISRIKMFYSYDCMLTDITKATGGSHEVTIVIELDELYMFDKKKRRGGFGFGNYTSGRTKAMPRALECSPF